MRAAWREECLLKLREGYVDILSEHLLSVISRIDVSSIFKAFHFWKNTK